MSLIKNKKNELKKEKHEMNYDVTNTRKGTIMEKQKLVEYIVMKHHEKYNRKISPIKLQKSLYFLFAFWANKIGIAENTMDDEIAATTELEEALAFDVNLFDADFEAWGFGPVDRSVYHWFLTFDYDTFIRTSRTINAPLIVKEYIDTLIVRIFNTGDFSLVDLCQEDKCWKKVFNPNVKNKMNTEDIITEYSMRNVL